MFIYQVLGGDISRVSSLCTCWNLQCVIVVSDIKLGHPLRLFELYVQAFTNLQVLNQNFLAFEIAAFGYGS